MKPLYRLRQTLQFRSMDGKHPPALPPDARKRINEQMAVQFHQLSSADQWHLIRVYEYLKSNGAQDDTRTAGLLHDVGKACQTSNLKIVDRSVHVLCNRFLGGPYARFASLKEPPERLRGLHLLANHAERGAEVAAMAGYNERICWLIRHHEKRQHPSETDPELLLLRMADDSHETSFTSQRLPGNHLESGIRHGSVLL